jgi:MYXO-CTERM domain-containing protein
MPPGAEPPPEEGGCSLAPAGAKSSTTALGIASLLALGLTLARRRRR